jgi:tRNA(Ile)-lysidine synthase
MAGSRKSPKNSGGLLIQISGVLRHHLQRDSRIVVALSGGVDSVVLCDLLRRYCKRRRCELRALHINHQISPNAAQWARFCRALCRAWKIPLMVVKVSVERGNSLEAAARTARYRVFAQQRTDFVALAHNRDDQAETLLLQLLRGAGVKGLSAMPVIRTEANVTLLRPLLDVSREEIEAYAWKHKLEWVDDESNSDIYFDRNFLRHEILPVLARRYPAYRTTLARTGRNLAESAQLLDELAEIDLDGTKSGEGVPVALLRRLDVARAKNALRYHLRCCGVVAPNAARLEECVRQALSMR